MGILRLIKGNEGGDDSTPALPQQQDGNERPPQPKPRTLRTSIAELSAWIESFINLFRHVVSRDTTPDHPLFAIQSRLRVLKENAGRERNRESQLRSIFEDLQRFLATEQGREMLAKKAKVLPFTFEEFTQRGFCGHEEKIEQGCAAAAESVIMNEIEIENITEEFRDRIWLIIDKALSRVFTARSKRRAVVAHLRLRNSIEEELKPLLDRSFKEDWVEAFHAPDSRLRELTASTVAREHLTDASLIADIVLVVRENIKQSRYKFLPCDKETRQRNRTIVMAPSQAEDVGDPEADEDALAFGRDAQLAALEITANLKERASRRNAIEGGVLVAQIATPKTPLRPKAFKKL